MVLKNQRKSRYIFIITILSLTVLALVIGTIVYVNEYRLVTTKKIVEIQSISNHKNKQVSKWFQDETNDALIISQNSALISVIKEIMKGDSTSLIDLHINLTEISSQHDYSNIILTDSKGTILFNTIDSDSKKHKYTRPYQPIYTNSLVSATNLYYINGEPYLDFISSLKLEGNDLKLIFQLNPGSSLFPILSYAPSDKQTLITNLISFTDDSVVLFFRNKAEKFHSVSKFSTDEIFKIIKRENKQILWAKDSEGKEVIAYLEPVTGTKWYLYAKVEVSEIYSSFNEQAFFLILISVMVLIVAVTVMSFLYSRQQRDIYKSLYLMFADSPQPMWIYDLNTLQFLEVNHAAITHYGYSKQEFLSMTLKDIRPDEDIPRLLDDVASTSNIYNDAGIWRHKKKNGDIIYVSIKSHLVEYNNHPARHVLANDITDIKVTQDALRESEMKFRHLFEEHSAVKLIIDPENGNIADANEAAARFYGYPRTELIRMNISQINMLNKENIEHEIKRVLSKSKIHFEFVHRKSDGTLVDVEVFSSRINISGKFFLHSIVHDISEKKKAKEQIETMVAELIAAKTKAEESDFLKTAFLANMSHEIRTPMNGIMGFMELLKQPGLSGDQLNEYIDIVKVSGERLLNTINDIIDISKIESGQSSLNEVPANVNQLIEEQFKFFEPEARKKNLDLKISSLLDNEHKLIIVDEVKLQSVIANLIKNALKFTKKGHISVGITFSDNKLYFTVSDTGIGIPPDRIESIFERFVQADVSMARDHEGSGLGLSISKAYIEMMGGSITVTSTLGRGSTFSFSIPYNPSDFHIPAERKQSTPDLALIPDNLTILVAEDDEISYIYLNRMLKRYKVNLLRVYNGQEAVDECQKNSDISLVLMDIKMPVMDGYEATRKIHMIQPDLPVIALTAFALSDDKDKALNAGCIGYLSKPVKKEVLFEAIRIYAKKETA